MDRRILIIDDDQEDVLLLNEALHKRGFTNLQFCLSAEEALTYLEKKPAHIPHLILTDLKMPVISGLDFIWTLKGRKAFKDIPIIVFSSSSDFLSKQKSLDAGAINFVSKPASFVAYDQFVERITKAILNSDVPVAML